MLIQQIVKRWTTHAQQARGFGNVPASFPKCEFNNFTLHFASCFARVERSTDLGLLQIKIAGGDQRAPSHDRRTLHPALKLTNVAAPCVLMNGIDSVGGKPTELTANFLSIFVQEVIGEKHAVSASVARRG